MGAYIGTDATTLIQTFGNPAALGNVPSSDDNPPYTFFLTLVPGIQIGQYDGRANFTGKGIARTSCRTRAATIRRSRTSAARTR